MKGLILSGGLGTRLYPASSVVNKQLLSIYDKPMIYYSFSTLISIGIKDIAIIARKDMFALYKQLFKNVKEDLGVNVKLIAEKKAKGIANAFLLAKKFIAKDSVCLVLGDCFLYGADLKQSFCHSREKVENVGGGEIYLKEVPNPQVFGVASIDEDGKVKKIVEKPEVPESNLAQTGIFFYDNTVIEKAKMLRPSARGELEITDINNMYINENSLTASFLGKNEYWYDMGSFDSMLSVSGLVQKIQNDTKCPVGSPEYESLRANFIVKEKYLSLAKNYKSSYKDLLENAIN